jgi:hypothetical protein
MRLAAALAGLLPVGAAAVVVYPLDVGHPA